MRSRAIGRRGTSGWRPVGSAELADSLTPRRNVGFAQLMHRRVEADVIQVVLHRVHRIRAG